MGFRYRKQIKIAPGVKLNISKSGISTSVGKRGATVNFSKRGTRTTVGIPGTGFSYSKNIPRRKRKTVAIDDGGAFEKMRIQQGLSKRMTKEVRKAIHRNPKRFIGMSSDEEIVKTVRKDLRKRTILAIIIVILVAIYPILKVVK